jgi:L-rhamnose isomerase/sugar isomerase
MILQEAFGTNVEPLLARVRKEQGLHPEPLRAYRDSGYAEKIASERVGELEGGSSWG